MFVFLVIHNVKCILRIKFSSVACLAAPYFPALPHKERHFLKINWNINVCFESSTNFVWNFLTLRRIQRDSTINFHTSSRSMDVILVRLQQSLNFLDGVLKSTHIPNFMKICPVGAELFHANRQTWRCQQSLFAILPKSPKTKMYWTEMDSRIHKRRKVL
jgi:hypothetical protein